MTIAVFLNILFATFVVTVIVGSLLWAIATQHRDHRTALAPAPRPRARRRARPRFTGMLVRDYG